MAEIDLYLKKIQELGGSDLHLLSGGPPKLRIHGELIPIEGEPDFDEKRMEQLLFGIIDPAQKEKFCKTRDFDFAYSLEGVARFRCNFFFQKRGLGAIFRIIPEKIKSLAQLNLPPAVEKLAHLQKGLVLVTGPTGSGKSTTLAALIDMINSTYPKHILTIEDPVEFVHSSKKSLIRQREVGADTKSFASAMRAALREDVDVVLVGEMRDYETISLAITLAETGQLVFGTLHTSSASKTIDRIIDVFPPEQQAQIRIMLADSLRGVLAQQLVPTKDGKGRVAAMELLFRSAALSTVIRDGKTQQITSIIQGGKSEGMQTIDSVLMELTQKGVIGAEEAYIRAQDKNAFQDLLEIAWMEAAGSGQTDRMNSMLKEGLNVDLKDQTGSTALMLASAYGHTEIVQALIEHAADPNVRDNNGLTALMRAAMRDNPDVIRTLALAQADINAKSTSGNTPLMIAGSAGNYESVVALLNAKAKSDIEDNLGCSVLMRAAMGGHTKIVEALLKADANVQAKDRSERTALMYAVEKGYPQIADLLIQAKADVNAKSKGGFTPLMIAAKGNVESISLLLNAGAEVNALTSDGLSSMTFALEKANAEVISALIDAGADVNAKTKTGMTPLMWAARLRPELIRSIVQAGADLNVKTVNGYTALRYAQEAQQQQSVDLLIECGARE
jgi:twitching motility protein PilT